MNEFLLLSCIIGGLVILAAVTAVCCSVLSSRIAAVERERGVTVGGVTYYSEDG